MHHRSSGLQHSVSLVEPGMTSSSSRKNIQKGTNLFIKRRASFFLSVHVFVFVPVYCDVFAHMVDVS